MTVICPQCGKARTYKPCTVRRLKTALCRRCDVRSRPADCAKAGRAGCATKWAGHRPPFTQAELQDCVGQGMSDRRIAKNFRCGATTIGRYRRRWDIPTPERKLPSKDELA